MVKTYKTLFMSTLLISTLISISSYSWLSMWMGLEINLLSIIPLMHSKENILSSESAVKYFIIQAMMSKFILLSIILMMNKTNLTTSMLSQSTLLMIMNSSLLTKMGTAPFHFWFPEVLEGLDWMNGLIILTWQKIAPMVLLMYNMKSMVMNSIVILASMIISTVMSMNQVSLRKILAYSSINHMGWMISSMMILETAWMYYFLVYSLISINLIMILKTMKIFFLNQLFQSMNSSPTMKMFFIMNFLSLSGIPPFLGFIPKWFTVQIMIQANLFLLSTFMIVITLVMIFVYIRITLSTLLMNTNESNWNSLKPMQKFSKFYLSMMNFFTITSLIIVTMTFNIL